jgi:formylglycine-generating enzyme required for sulfatase activity
MQRFLRPLPLAAGAAVFLALTLPSADDAAAKGKGKVKGCPAGMSNVMGKFCIDKYEASTVEVLPGGKTQPHSPYASVDGLKVKAVSKKGVKPQAYISRDQAEAACEVAGKRLCTDDEWMTACKGKKPTQYPYGDDHKDGYCNDAGVSSFNHYYGNGAEPDQSAYTWSNMNDPRLNQLAGTLAPTGKFKKCRNGFDVYDMVGNLHEWTAAKGGTFRGGYYLDTHINGDGCDYRTTAHDGKYHDYSTGFRCCK